MEEPRRRASMMTHPFARGVCPWHFLVLPVVLLSPDGIVAPSPQPWPIGLCSDRTYTPTGDLRSAIGDDAPLVPSPIAPDRARRRRVFDAFTFMDELDMLEVHLAELFDVVDVFVVAEATTTFQGSRKPLVLADALAGRGPDGPRGAARWARYASKLRLVRVDDMPSGCDGRSARSAGRGAGGAGAWACEWHQRNALLRAMPDLADDDLVIVSDVDEILRAPIVRWLRLCDVPMPARMSTRFFYYSLQWQKRAPWAHPNVATGAQARQESLQWIRHDAVAADAVPLPGGGYTDGGVGRLRVARNAVQTPQRSSAETGGAQAGSGSASASAGEGPAEIRNSAWRVRSSARVDDAGWHLSFFMSAGRIAEKLRSFSHTEYAGGPWTDLRRIERAVDGGEDLFARGAEHALVRASAAAATDVPRLLVPGGESTARFASWHARTSGS
jgi:hypothetical protein